MKNALKILLFLLIGMLGIVYAAYLFVIPNLIKLDKYKPELVSIVKEQSKLDIDFKNPKIITTPLLGAGLKVDDISVKLPDGTLLFSADSLKTRIALPSLFLLTVKVSCLEVENPFVNLEIAEDNSDYKIVKLIEDILNENKEKTLGEEVAEEEGFKFNPAWIRIKVPALKLNNYKVLITDLRTKHYLDLHGDKLVAGYFNGKTAKIKTYAELFSDDNKNITANINLNTFIPKKEPSLDSEDDPAERIDIPFVNPVQMYRNYDLKTNVDTKLRVREHNGHLTSYGHAYIDNLTLRVSNLVIPESYLKVNTFGSNLKIDTKINPAKNQNISLLGSLNYGKHKHLDMNISSSEILFNDLLSLGKAFLDSLSVSHELGQYTASGSLKADCHIKTNFKKMKSNGFLLIKDGGVKVRNLGNVISNANININLDNDTLNIDDSMLSVNNSKVNVDGFIDEKSNTSIRINADKISLPLLFNAFAPKNLRELYNFKSGSLTLKASLEGRLKQALVSAQFGILDLNISDKKNTFNLINKKLVGNLSLDTKKKSVLGSVDNDDFIFVLPKTGSVVKSPKLAVKIADKNISINENKILFNNNSEIKYSGEITNYEKLDAIQFNAIGAVDTSDIVKFLGTELKSFIHYAGSVPVKISVDGNKKKQTLFLQVLCNRDSYITPLDINEIQNKETTLQAVLDLKPNRIKIKKTGLYERVVTVDEEGKELIKLNDILDIDGTVEGDRINLIKIRVPKDLNCKLFVFPRSSFQLEKTRVYIFGPITTPIIRGSLNLKDISIPEILTNIKNIKFHFVGHDLSFGLEDINLNGSDISLNGVLNLLPSNILRISKFDVISQFINLDKLLVVAERAQKYVPAQKTTSTAKHQQSDIPLLISNGSINMRRIKTGNIELYNTMSRLVLANNILGLNRLRTNIFNGNVNGNIDVNLLTTLVKVNLSGDGVNVAKALLDAAGMKDMLSGTASFNANLEIDGAASSIEEQMKGISGVVDFNIKDGQYGPFGKIENLIIAENIRESQFFQTALGGIINSLTSIDTTHFAELSGLLSFEGGVCHIEPITSLGTVLTLHIFGDFDLVKNYADMKVRAKMSSIVSKVLGPLNAINPINLMNSAASLNVVTAKAFSLFCEVVPSEELDTLPSFANKYVDSGAAKFQLKVKGDAAKPLTLVKSFKWLASQAQFDEAENFVNSLPEEIEGSTAENIQEAIAEAQALEAEKKTVKYKVKHLFSRDKESSKNNK